MSFLPQVIGARHISGFIVSTRFDDGSEKYIDVSQRVKGPVFAWRERGNRVAPKRLVTGNGATNE